MSYARPVARDLALLAGGSLAGFLLARALGRRGRGRRPIRAALRLPPPSRNTEIVPLPVHSRAVGRTLESLGLVAPTEDPGATNMTSEGGPLTGAEHGLPPVPSAVPADTPRLAPGVRLVAIVRDSGALTDLDPQLELRAGDALVVTGPQAAIEDVTQRLVPAH